MKRRDFVKVIFSTIAVSGLGGKLKIMAGNKSSFPVAVGTWKHSKGAIEKAKVLLEKGFRAIDVVEKSINITECDPDVMSVGYGGLPNEEGVVQLDAAIMDGATLRCGAVAALEGIKIPISVARKVMETTKHIMLVGEGAKKFALANGFKEENLLTDRARERWLEWKRNLNKNDNWLSPDQYHDTIGVIILDSKGSMATGVSTSGLAWKIPGRIGDSPIVGAGSYCDNQAGGAVATGVGEEVIRVAGCHLIVELMRMGWDPQKACEEALKRIIKANNGKVDFQDAFLAVRKDGEIGAASLKKGFQYYVYSEGKISLKQSKYLVN